MTPPSETVDVLIIGGGQAGVPLAHALAKAGKRVALAERKNLGGSCVNFGCTPTKAAIASARVAHLARRGADFGLTIPRVEVNFPAVIERARGVALNSRNGLDHRFEGSENPKLLRGHATLAGRAGEGFRVRLGDRDVETAQLVLNTGTRSSIPVIEGLDGIDFLDAGNWLERPELPEHLAVIGGGYIGVEMGQFYRRMGSEVTVIVRGGRILDHEDEDVTSAMQSLLEAEGIRFLFNSEITRVRDRKGGLTLELAGAPPLDASHLFVATGRKPNTDDLGLESIGLPVGKGGFIEVDERLATRIQGVWAAGDIRGGPMFTHTSWDDYRILLSQMTGDGARTTSRVVPYAVFTDPELGRVGMTERAAREAGKPVKVGRFEMRQNGKAAEIGETEGFIKVVVEAGTERILGAAVLAVEGAELVHMYIDLMNADAPYSIMRDAVHIHPTLAEAVQSAVSAIE